MHFKDRELYKLVLALAVYCTSLIAANTLGVKLMPFLFGTHLSVAVFSFPIVFLMTDVIGEVYGKKIARMFFVAGFVTTILYVLYSLLSVAMPWGERGLWVKDAYNQVFGGSIRISIASIVAFGIAEYQDFVSFFFFKAKMEGKHFWLRSNLSNLWSQFLDTTIFMTVAFYGVYPVATLIGMIIPWWLFKVGMGIFYTPLSYVGISYLRSHGESEK